MVRVVIISRPMVIAVQAFVCSERQYRHNICTCVTASYIVHRYMAYKMYDRHEMCMTHYTSRIYIRLRERTSVPHHVKKKPVLNQM